MGKMKIVRLGHRQANRTGVVTIASEIENDRLYIGVSYCSPKEFEEGGLGYDKKSGNDIALHRLAQAKAKDEFIFFTDELKYSNVLNACLQYIFDEEKYPRWAEPLLIEAARYPVGLKRYSKKYNFSKGNNPVEIKKIVVNSEEAKEQLLLAFRYLHDLREVDTDFLAANVLVHMYLNSASIVVEPNAA